MTKEFKNLKQFSKSADKFEGAHLLCPGCAHGMIIREVLNAVDGPLVIGNSTGCLEVSTAVFPHTSWDVPWIHIGFENGSTAACGAEAMYKALERKGKYKGQRPKFVAFGGDGSTYDIGFQWISGCFERGHDFTYVCLDNEVYANTGGQRSGSTPLGASTSTTPAGSTSYGKKQKKKDLLAIMAAHGSPYVAQVAPNKWKDMNAKIKRAIDTEGPTFINAMSACTTEWKFQSNNTVEMSDLAVDSLVFPLYEIIDGHELRITYRPKKVIPVREYLAAQGRFKHLFKPENEHIIEQFQKDVNDRWELLQRREESKL
ncbi:pyruvate ferredoxin oxidoreductase [Helicobacter saguini]|uniref:Pyruvate ferredoxin oxidoreductase n=1 Tax=Helicobacter saguini TaxID=1548018 RepID=A0A347VTI9_9HELI|nr:thiamine pyrophosphate-dependent enzyme [Helicobacter saguini]MWV62077.1 pyruvate ferredoxin oxidoreductase [Helicobacter saguini]MWV67251.1 pyruvate ferredoxin oxidoreductase [Helicobacter saguini]MWV69603.1 pyruvate ferredoxin oxidoreductase [Helicobacter saguini]MWV70846.1 pyruvate ferredoxin oxidoreductase [Helicobacter saguini]TLD94318.1 pyruvate ferredoxin oxidoreductase [Helicobacter saguini]